MPLAGPLRHTRRLPLSILLPALLAHFFAFTPARAQQDGSPPCSPPAAVAARLLEGTLDWQTLPAQASYTLDDALLADEGRLRAELRLTLGATALERLRSARPVLCVSLVLDAEGTLPVAHQQRLTLDLTRATGWRYGFATDLPETASQLLVIVEEPASRRLGAVLADDLGEMTPPGPDAIRLANAWHEVLKPVKKPTGVPGTSVVVRLVPPRQELVSGSTRFDALVTTDAVDRVVFRLDGDEVANQRRRPYAARIPLDDPPRPQVLEAIAFDRDDREIGRDTFEVNRRDIPFRARIEAVDGDATSGSILLTGRIDVPADATLDRVELYLGEILVGRFTEPRVRSRVSTAGTGPDDYLRLAAFLVDGRTIDDVVLLASPTLVEEVEVNLVELYTVVTDAQGQPVDDLRAEDFTLVFEGRRQQPQSVAFADDVSLLVGLVVDTSGSMELVMHDTRRAAAKFLGTTVLPQDRAFLVDFDAEPRLLHPTTDDLPALLLDLANLHAGGATAMYDAVVFSMLQFEHHAGRKALVVLTDGDDYESSFGPKYCADLAQRTGVPIYVIGLGQLDTLRRAFSKRDLRKVSEGTGGRLYFVESIAELDQAYAQIQAELRSQYTLTLYVDRDLDESERRSIKIELARPGLEARTVVGPRPPVQ